MAQARSLIDRLTGWSPVLLLGGLAALTYWLDAQVQPRAPRTDGSARHDPDLFLVDFRATNFGADGKPVESLVAKRADHFPDDQSAELTAPQMRITQPGKPAFSVTAARGRVSGDRENVWFTGQVRAVREGGPAPAAPAADAAGATAAAAGGTAAATATPPLLAAPSGPVTLETEYLHVVPKQDKVDSDQPVTIREPRGIIAGVGLELDNKAKIARLKSKVSGTFQPQKPPSEAP